MKGKVVVTVALLLFASLAAAGEFQLEPTQNPDAPYRLFNTQNIYTLLKLDTSTGRIWQVPWGDKDHRYTQSINLKGLVPAGEPRRVTLNSTRNIYPFILLDQGTADTWMIQWGKSEDRIV